MFFKHVYATLLLDDREHFGFCVQQQVNFTTFVYALFNDVLFKIN